MITTRTSDLLGGMAGKLQAIASAIYEAGYREEGRQLEGAAFHVATVAASIEGKIEAGARAMLSDAEGDKADAGHGFPAGS